MTNEIIKSSIYNNHKIKFEYWKYEITNKLEKQIVSTPTVSPFAIVYNKQEFYFIGINDGQDKFYHYRLDRMKNVKELNARITIKKTKIDISQKKEKSISFGAFQSFIFISLEQKLQKNIVKIIMNM